MVTLQVKLSHEYAPNWMVQEVFREQKITQVNISNKTIIL